MSVFIFYKNKIFRCLNTKPSKKPMKRQKKHISQECTMLLNCVPLLVPKESYSYFLSYHPLCVWGVLNGFAQSAWIIVSDTKEQQSGGELLDLCFSGIWVQVQRQQLYHSMFLNLGPWQHHFKDVIFSWKSAGAKWEFTQNCLLFKGLL